MDLVLFDIDGTLVDTGGAGRRAIEEAARQLYGKSKMFEGIHFEGATDKSICRAALHKLDRPWDEDEIDRLLDVYVDILSAEVAASPNYRIYPGALALVRALGRSGVLLGLGTGNIEAGARIKLARGGLNDFFSFGGFGSDAEERSALLRAGLKRGEQILRRPAREPWIIGDTPRDWAAAKAIGARVVLVATGRYDLATLNACTPDLCVETLEDPRVLALAAKD